MGHHAAGRAYVYPRGLKATCTRISSPRPKRRLPREIKRIARVHARYGTSPRVSPRFPVDPYRARLIPSLSTSPPSRLPRCWSLSRGNAPRLTPREHYARRTRAARGLNTRAHARCDAQPSVTRVSDAERDAGARGSVASMQIPIRVSVLISSVGRSDPQQRQQRGEKGTTGRPG